MHSGKQQQHKGSCPHELARSVWLVCSEREEDGAEEGLAGRAGAYAGFRRV